MTTAVTKVTFNRKIDNIQHQLDIMRRESETFRAHSNNHFEFVHNELATKEDLRNLQATMVTKDDHIKLTTLIEKIAKKVGVAL